MIILDIGTSFISFEYEKENKYSLEIHPFNIVLHTRKRILSYEKVE